MNEPVVVDGNIITSYCPETAPKVAFELLKMLTSEKEMEVIKKAISDYNEKEPSYKVIKNIVFRTEEFEKTTSKKIKRKYD